MYLDTIIVSGVLVVAATLVFFGGFFYVAMKDASKTAEKHD